jgi:membrane-associated phospholipid phosphatase
MPTAYRNALTFVLALLLLAFPVMADENNPLRLEKHLLDGFQIDPGFMHTLGATRDGSPLYPPYPKASVAYQWVDILQEVAAREVDKVGARPTIIARQMAIVMTGIYDAWAAYDERAVGTRLGGSLRRPMAERSQTNKEKAIAYAAYRCLLYVFEAEEAYIRSEFVRLGYDPDNDSANPKTPEGVGNLVSRVLIEYRSQDGSNQEGSMPGSAGAPYADYTGYQPVNTVEKVTNPDHWQPKLFTFLDGRQAAPGALTPQWGRVKPLVLKSSDQFRPGPPPKVESRRLKAEVDEVIRYNATLTPTQKATIEFMRDGPRSTAQSGHWLRFAQDLSRRDSYDLDADVKLFFAVANVCSDAFIACWDAKYVYDSSRPMTLVRHYYKGQTLPGWRGYGQGTGPVSCEQWTNYSPTYFLCPPFPAYPSGHSTVSAGAATILKLYSGSDWFGFCAPRVPGSITHEPMDQVVLLELPTFSATAEMAGISRVMGGYHIQSDNIAGLELGRQIANYSWPRYQAYFDGTAQVRD